MKNRTPQHQAVLIWTISCRQEFSRALNDCLRSNGSTIGSPLVNYTRGMYRSALHCLKTFWGGK